ncbi:radical S-adenosyl methionine domain-containing protein 1, mitochondrial-like [Oncorhynchus keta]|uniref:radical S-adenosyl methionine domain-containing protein 1, mitochondrial-like n=1 Tax=Oncorhynchus keta TaxID=8018 RepID=UPI00227C0EEA|nr:radical S-adenosyl methionine domain-containing protein 1, mitochondrial-like [Oncorhynchus keta]
MLRALLTAVRGPAVCVGRCFSSEVSGAVSTLAGFSSPPFSTEASLYVHWPYCLKRCSYCNFNKYIPRSDNQDVMLECLQRETETLLKLSQVSRITSVFFGGGTPSLARPSTIAAVLETVARHAGLSEEAEVTLEVNPTPVGSSKLEDFLHAGVNRFSIGVQAVTDH